MEKVDYSTLGPVGGNAGGVIENVASSAKGAVCTLYQNYQAWYHQNINLQTPVGHVLEQFWDKVCPNVPPYTPPSSQPGFNGGQCPFEYIVSVEVATPGAPLYYQGRAIGPIGGLYKGWTSWTPGYSPPQIEIRGLSSNIVGYAHWTGSGGANSNYQSGNASITSLVPSAGQPDTCGNSPGNPPPLDPPPQVKTDIDVYGPNGSTYKVPISINPKIVIAKDLVGIDVNVGPFDFNPSINPQFDFNPQINFKPELNLKFGDEGVFPEFNLPEPNGSGSLNCDPCVDLKEILDILKETHTYNARSLGSGKSFFMDGIEQLAFVEVLLTKQPTTTKIIISDTGVNAMYTGWIHFRREGVNFEKQQLTSTDNVFWSPKGADGFSIQLTHNSQGVCTYYTKQ